QFSRGAGDCVFERQLLVCMERVVVNEDANRALRRQEVREAIDHRSKMTRADPIGGTWAGTHQRPAQIPFIELFEYYTPRGSASKQSAPRVGRNRRTSNLQGEFLPGAGKPGQDSNSRDPRPRRTYGSGASTSVGARAADRLAAARRSQKPQHRHD